MSHARGFFPYTTFLSEVSEILLTETSILSPPNMHESSNP
jgi:hypothetical protein